MSEERVSSAPPARQPGVRVAGDHHAPHPAMSHAVGELLDGEASSTAFRAAVLATMARYCRGGRVDVADHREVRSYDVDIDSSLSALLRLAATPGEPVPGTAEASVALLPVDTVPVADAAIRVHTDGRQYVTTSPARLHGQVAVRHFSRAVRTFLDVFAAADGETLSRLPVAAVGILPADDTGAELALGRGEFLPQAEEQVHRTVVRLAAEVPDRSAIEDEDTRLTYRELAIAVLATRDRMRAAGLVGRGTVAVAMERGAGSAVAQLAAFASECRVVLVDPALPAARIAYMLRDSGAGLVAVASDDDGVARTAASLGIAALTPSLTPAVPDADRSAADLREAAVSLPGLPEDAVSHIAYTSGSTGAPKAVQLRHGPMRNTAAALGDACGLSSSSRGSWFCPPGVGMVEVDMFPVLAAGGTVVVAPPSVSADPTAVRQWLIDRGITHTLQTTAVAEQLLAMEWPAAPALVSMRVAGEKQRVWPAPDCPFQVLNVYGSTEANVVAVCDLTQLVRSGAGRSDLSPPIGRSVRNVNMYILDEELRPMPRHSVGELCVSGRSLSRGYLHQDAANAERFLPNPIPEDGFPVLYRSGDLAWMDSTGLVNVIGRLDDEVKVAGYRVHPGAVEGQLSTLPGVAACAVVAGARGDGGSYLIAYVERTSDPRGSSLTGPGVREELERLLPAYMIPSAVRFLSLPLTRNGKIDRAALRDMDTGRGGLDTGYRAPSSDVERLLVQLFTEVLGRSLVGADDHFFELGGSSLSAAALIRKATDALGAELTMVDLMEAPTAARLARRVPAG
ncbi:non-ribosomal peptide synthetase [Streptomyces sp. NPDC059883]|uniref:non-ribosomal peptide synthetase n=1 Tax=unclassified Streptomyces TaxID=2593676 RepID=UPI00366304B2